MLSYLINFSLWYQLYIIVPSFCLWLFLLVQFEFKYPLPSFKVLSSYKPKGKGLGEMATEIMAKAELATSDADLQTQLGLKAFLQAVPRNIGRAWRRRHFDSVKEALKEAHFLQSVEEDEGRGSGKIFTVDSDSTPSVVEPKPDIQQIVEACMKQMQAHQARTERSERPRSSKRKLRCWCC